MRSLLHAILACLTLACPFICGADELDHSARHEHAGKADAPAHCPDAGGDYCFCRGAVPTGDARVAAARAVTATPPCLPSPPLQTACFVHRAVPESSPFGLAAWGDSLTVRAWLQNFLC